MKNQTYIIIPCYNEEKGLDVEAYKRFLSKVEDTTICFVNDGSTDNTIEKIEDITSAHPNKAILLDLKLNKGKANAVYEGINYINKKFDYTYIGYLDADLATTLSEFCSIKSQLKKEITFVFGSRILKLGSTIERSSFRFLTGRIIATFISKILKLGVYDTQCGCKVFTKELATKVFDKPFISKWLFDVEIFFRALKVYGRGNATKKILEVPLRQWIDKGDSKVKLSYFVKIWIDLYLIKRKYKNI